MPSNRDIVGRFVEIINAHDFRLFGEVVAADYRQHNPHSKPGLDGLIAFFEDQLREMPDLKGSIEVLVSEGDNVAARTLVTGTRAGVPASMSITDFWRVANGKLAEHW